MGCERNMVPADEDVSPFRVTYRPCGAPVAATVSWRYGECGMCPEHAREAELEGNSVEWTSHQSGETKGG